jgi:hypothetical protein
MAKDFVKAEGKVTLVLTGSDGAVKETREVENLVVQVGLNYIASRMKDATATAMTHMEVGTSSTAASLAQTTLVAAVSASRTALTSTTVTTSSVAYACTFNAGTGTGALTEAGIFNASSAGTMLCRTVFSVINKGAADTLTITWTIAVS